MTEIPGTGDTRRPDTEHQRRSGPGDPRPPDATPSGAEPVDLATLPSGPMDWPPDPATAFAEALRAAVAERGLALDRIRAHLLAAGHEVSIATLSYWQTGRSAPVRRSSIEAIGALEVILRVPRGRLARALLDSQAARRALADPATELNIPDHTGWLSQSSGAEAADAVIAEMGLTWDADVDRLVQHDVLVMGADRRPQRHTTRDIIIARAPHVDRVVMARHGGEPGRLALVTGGLGCRLGRSRVLPAHLVTVSELLLERPLHCGALHVMEHDVRLVGGERPMDWFSRAYLSHTQEGVIRIQFRADDLPTEIGVFVGGFTAEPRYEPASLCGTTLVVARHDFPPGQMSLRWTWPRETPTGGAPGADVVRTP